MSKALSKTVLFTAALLLLCGYLFFFRLGGMALTDPDETFYAQTAKEMFNRGEWATPYLYDKPQFEKPIFFYWLVEISYKIFGINEFAARFPSALFALTGIAGMYLLGKILFNKRVGVFSALMLATSVEYIILSRACVTDMTLFVFMLLGVLFFFYGQIKEKWHFYALSSASFAFATLTKGPIFVVLPLTVIFIYMLWTGGFKTLKKIPLILCAMVFLVIAAPWYLLAYKMHGRIFIDAFFGFHNITRFLESEHKIGSQVYYNIPVILGGYFPWSVFLPFGLWHIFKKDSRRRRAVIFILSWFIVIFLFFTASSTKLPTYVFPAFISLALITAVLWDDFLREGEKGNSSRGVKISYYLLPVIVVIGTVSALIYVHFDYPVIIKGLTVACSLLILGILLSFAAFRLKKFEWALALIVYSLVIFIYPFGRLVLPAVERYETSKYVSLKLLSLIKPGEKIASESNYLAGFAFYTGRIPEYDVDRHHTMVQFLNSDDRVWCVLKDKNHRGLYDPAINSEYIKPSYAVYRIGKRTLITNKVPDDGKYLLKREKPK